MAGFDPLSPIDDHPVSKAEPHCRSAPRHLDSALYCSMPMNSRPSPGRSGFRRWHERQLFEAFGWLAVCLLCGVVFAAVLELVGLSTPGLTPIFTMVVLYLTGLAGVAAWRRFWSTL